MEKSFFSLAPNARACGHPMKGNVRRFGAEERKPLCINLWNGFSQEAVMDGNLDCFKGGLDELIPPPSPPPQVSDVKEKLRLMRRFWVLLPHALCSDEKVAADVTNEDSCWNGQARGRWGGVGPR